MHIPNVQMSFRSSSTPHSVMTRILDTRKISRTVIPIVEREPNVNDPRGPAAALRMARSIII
jgi:hypothetical protein